CTGRAGNPRDGTIRRRNRVGRTGRRRAPRRRSRSTGRTIRNSESWSFQKRVVFGLGGEEGGRQGNKGEQDQHHRNPRRAAHRSGERGGDDGRKTAADRGRRLEAERR